jgi:ABC-type polar amino acid transport system ATPase subunit
MRAHLARALAAGPRVLLLEHATASLPREDVAAFAAVVRRLTDGTTAVVALSEDAEFDEVAAERRLTLHPGTGRLSEAGGWKFWRRRG